MVDILGTFCLTLIVAKQVALNIFIWIYNNVKNIYINIYIKYLLSQPQEMQPAEDKDILIYFICILIQKYFQIIL